MIINLYSTKCVICRRLNVPTQGPKVAQTGTNSFSLTAGIRSTAWNRTQATLVRGQCANLSATWTPCTTATLQFHICFFYYQPSISSRDYCQKLALALTSNPKSAIHSICLSNNSVEDRGQYAIMRNIVHCLTCVPFKADTSLRWTVRAGPQCVHLRGCWLYSCLRLRGYVGLSVSGQYYKHTNAHGHKRRSSYF